MKNTPTFKPLKSVISDLLFFGGVLGVVVVVFVFCCLFFCGFFFLGGGLGGSLKVDILVPKILRKNMHYLDL